MKSVPIHIRTRIGIPEWFTGWSLWCPPPQFWMTENEFRSHFSPFQINTQLLFWFVFTKWLPAAILDDRKSLLIAFLAISDQYSTLTFFILFTKWLPAAILDDRKSHSIAFLAISDQYATLFLICSQNGCRRPFWMNENHFRSHFSPFQINAQLWFLFTKWLPAAILDEYTTLILLFNFHKMAAGGHFGWPKITFDHISRHFRSIHNFSFLIFFSKWPPAAILEVRFAPKTIGFFHYVLSMAMPNMKLIGEFMTQLEMPQSFWAFWYKMAARGHFVFPIDAKNHRVLVIWDLNGYGEYKFDRCICDKVMVCTSIGVRRRDGGDGGDGGGATKNIMLPKFSNFGDIITELITNGYTWLYIGKWISGMLRLN